MGTRIIIQTKGAESAPIVIDTRSKSESIESVISTESYGDIFMSEESIDLEMSLESMPRLSGIKPTKRSMRRNIYVSTIDEYVAGQKENIEKIKKYIESKGWVSEGINGLAKIPTLITRIFKDFGFKGDITFTNARKHIIEKTVNGLTIVFVHTDNSNNSQYNKINDIRSKKDYMRGYLILSKNGKDKFFCKTITPRIVLESENFGASNYSETSNVNVVKTTKKK